MTTRQAEAQLVAWADQITNPRVDSSLASAAYRALFPLWRAAFRAGREEL